MSKQFQIFKVNGSDQPCHKKFLAVLDKEQAKRGLSQNKFGAFLGLGGGADGRNHGVGLQHWRTGRNGITFWLVIQIWKKLGRSLDKDFL